MGFVGSILFYSVFHQQTPEMDKAKNPNFPDPTLFKYPKIILKVKKVSTLLVPFKFVLKISLISTLHFPFPKR